MFDKEQMLWISMFLSRSPRHTIATYLIGSPLHSHQNLPGKKREDSRPLPEQPISLKTSHMVPKLTEREGFTILVSLEE